MPMRSLLRASAFALLAAAAYVGLLLVLATVPVRGAPALLRIYNGRPPGRQGHSLARFREADQRGQVEVIALGSSHCARGLDPRAFEAAGMPERPGWSYRAQWWVNP